MKYFLCKILIYTLAIAMLLPTWLVSGIIRAPKAHAAALAVNGGASSTIVNGSGSYFELTPLVLNSNAPGDINSTLDIQVVLDSTTAWQLNFDTAAVITALPSANLDLGAGNGTAVPPATVSATVLDFAVATTSSASGDSVIISGLKVKATASGTTSIFSGNDHLIANGIASDGVIAVDAQKPTILQAATQDKNQNGYLDSIRLTFLEKIDDETVQASLGNFLLGTGTYILETTDTGVGINDMEIDLLIKELKSPDTGAKPILSYTAGSIADINGNLLPVTAMTTQDLVSPVMLWARTVTLSTIEVTFSEDLKGSTVNSSGNEFFVSSPSRTVSAASEISAGIVRLTVTPSLGADEKPTINFAGNIKDQSDNVVISAGPIIASDGIAPLTEPYLLDLKYIEGANKTDEQLEIGFSEAISEVGAISDYTIIYEQIAGTTRTIDFFSAPMSKSGDNTRVVITIPDQSPHNDTGGKFKVTVSANVKDAAGFGVDQITVGANTARTDTIVEFDTAPVITLNNLVSNNPSPALGGTVDDATAVIVVTITGQNFSALNNGDGSWSLAQGVIAPALADGVYDVILTAVDAAGKITTQTFIGALTINAAAPILSTVSITSSNAEKDKARPGDMITLTIATAEPINLPAVTIGNVLVEVAGSQQNFSASRLMTANDAVGEVVFEINFSDLLGNPGLPVKATTDGSRVTFSLPLPTPEIALSKIEENGNKIIRIEWRGIAGGVEKYQIFINGVTGDSFTIAALENDANAKYFKEIRVLNLGQYDVFVLAIRGNESSKSQSQNVEFIAATVAAPVAVTTTVTPKESISASPAPLRAQAQEPASVQARPPAPSEESVQPAPEEKKDDQSGVIKGEERAEEAQNKINWTPWIILFVLIILAGAATGAYFYWFGGEEEETAATQIKQPEPKTEERPLPKRKPGGKRSKRW